MIITGYGIELHRLKKKDIEMLRNWRNAPDISRHMEYREYITSEMQQKWFAKINTPLHFYFIIYHENKAIGMIHLSDIDVASRTGVAGLFISDNSYLNSPYPASASMLLLDFAFKKLHLSGVAAKVKRDNARAMNYNAQLGFERQEIDEGQAFCRLWLAPEKYATQTTRIRKSLVQLYGNQTGITLDKTVSTDRAIGKFWNFA